MNYPCNLIMYLWNHHLEIHFSKLYLNLNLFLEFTSSQLSPRLYQTQHFLLIHLPSNLQNWLKSITAFLSHHHPSHLICLHHNFLGLSSQCGHRLNFILTIRFPPFSHFHLGVWARRSQAMQCICKELIHFLGESKWMCLVVDRVIWLALQLYRVELN